MLVERSCVFSINNQKHKSRTMEPDKAAVPAAVMDLEDPTLTEYYMRWLTEPEIALSKLIETGHEVRADELRAELLQRKIMSQRTLSVQQQSDLSSKFAAKKRPVPEPLQQQASKEVKKEVTKPAEAAVAAEALAQLQKKEIEKSKATREAATSRMDVVRPDSPEDVAVPPLPAAPIQALPAKTIKKRAIQEEDDAMDVVMAPQDLFSPEGMISETVWNSIAPNAESQVFNLPGFGYRAKQTLGLKLTVPNDAKSWSFNICPARDYHNNNILLHFNPRYNEKTVVMNDKQGTWGAERSRHLAPGASSKTDGLLAKDIDLMVQIRSDAFYIFANGMYNSCFPHRREPATTSNENTSINDLADLKLIVNARDAKGKTLDLVLNKVWWGHREPSRDILPFAVQNKIDRQCSDERAALARAVPFADRSIMIRGLPMGVFDFVECREIVSALKDVFSELVMEGTSVVPGQGYGFIRFSTAEVVSRAIEEMNGGMIRLIEQREGGSVLRLSPMVL